MAAGPGLSHAETRSRGAAAECGARSSFADTNPQSATRNPQSAPAPLLVFAGGGTGGHLNPGIALARAVRRAAPAVEIRFLTSGKPLEARLLDTAGFAYEVLPAAPLARRAAALPGFLRTAGAAYQRAVRAFRARRPRLVVGLGGYVAVWPCLAARACGVPVVLLEQNARPGRANRLLARVADEVCIHFDEARAHLRGAARITRTGTPLAAAPAAVTPAEARASFGLEPARPTLLVTGGSQGARELDRRVAAGLAAYADDDTPARPRFQVLHQCHRGGREELARAYRACGLAHHVAEFLDRMDLAYRAADLVICRAGATTLAELARQEAPAVLVPLPSAAEDHQTANARAFAQDGGALLVPQHELTPAALSALIGDWQGATPRGAALCRAARARAATPRPNAAALVLARLAAHGLPLPGECRPAGYARAS